MEKGEIYHPSPLSRIGTLVVCLTIILFVLRSIIKILFSKNNYDERLSWQRLWEGSNEARTILVVGIVAAVSILLITLYFFVTRVWHAIVIFPDRVEDRTPFRTKLFWRSSINDCSVVVDHQYSGAFGFSRSYAQKQLQFLDKQRKVINKIAVDGFSDKDISAMLLILNGESRKES
jgi:hypothetical protein